MNLYVTIRWGNHESPDGADGEDTHFLVRAGDHIEAAKLTDLILGSMPTSSPDHQRRVQPFCHRIVQLGSDGNTRSDIEARVLMGPWVAYGYAVHSDGYPTWSRDYADPNIWERES